MMMVYNHRMVEGSPLQYYTSLVPPPFPFFKRFDVHDSAPPEMNEEMLPPSPNSTQSDSDNSISSVEHIQEVPVRCCWKSCGVPFQSLDQLATHVTRVHAASGAGGLFYCGWEGCNRNNRGFNARYKMLVHVRTHTNEKPHKCDKCEKSFSRAENLKIHSRSHSGEKPYVCPVPGCKKAYSNSSDRFKHTRTHQVEKPYKCKIPGCPKRYTDPSSLRKHVKTYKHFVTERERESDNNSRVVENKTTTTTTEVPEPSNFNCMRSCCVGGDLKETKVLRLEAFLDFKSERWNGFLEERTTAFRPYEQMEVDVPLDLSIGRRRFS